MGNDLQSSMSQPAAEDHLSIEDIEVLKHKLVNASYTKHGSDMGSLFDEIDKNGDGYIDIYELAEAVKM